MSNFIDDILSVMLDSKGLTETVDRDVSLISVSISLGGLTLCASYY